jgi:hypothetical protein
MTGETKQEILYSALMKLNDKFCDGMKWSPEATDHEKTLVKCNINGFCGFLSKALPANADASESEVGAEILRIMKVYHEQDAKGSVDTPGGLEHMGDVWALFKSWERKLQSTDA